MSKKDKAYLALQERTIEAFTPALKKWLDDTEGEPKEAFAALASWFGHALGAAAVALRIEGIPRIAVSTGELVAENMSDDIAAQTFCGKFSIAKGE